MHLLGLNVEAVGNPRGFHEQLEGGLLGPEFIGVWVEVRYQHTLKCRVMVKFAGDTITVNAPQGFGMSDELRLRVGEVGKAAIVHAISALERRQMNDRNMRAIDCKKP